MGSTDSQFLPVPKDDYKALKSSTKFTNAEIDYLYTRFRELGKPKGRKNFLVKADFYFSSYALHSVLLQAIFGEKNRINFVEFAKFLSLFRVLDTKATDEERKAAKTKKLKLLFSMYDVNKDGDISKHDLLHIVDKLYSQYATFEKMVEIVNCVMKEMDTMNINRILFDDFCDALECFDMEQVVIKFPVL